MSHTARGRMLDVEIDGAVALLTMNRPDKRNR